MQCLPKHVCYIKVQQDVWYIHVKSVIHKCKSLLRILILLSYTNFGSLFGQIHLNIYICLCSVHRFRIEDTHRPPSYHMLIFHDFCSKETKDTTHIWRCSGRHRTYLKSMCFKNIYGLSVDGQNKIM